MSLTTLVPLGGDSFVSSSDRQVGKTKVFFRQGAWPTCGLSLDPHDARSCFRCLTPSLGYAALFCLPVFRGIRCRGSSAGQGCAHGHSDGATHRAWLGVSPQLHSHPRCRVDAASGGQRHGGTVAGATAAVRAWGCSHPSLHPAQHCTHTVRPSHRACGHGREDVAACLVRTAVVAAGVWSAWSLNRAHPGVVCWRRYNRMRSAVISVQCLHRGAIARAIALALRQHLAATGLQRLWRGVLQRERYACVFI